ncbi:MAG: glycosyltransferase family 2 protein [Bacteroidetes bacterium]|nr:glycosyltransferase family 2 protein [Bacteroidota bacterium]
MQLSIVIPFYNEEESLPELISWIQRVVDTHRFSYEIIMVDDGSNDNSWEVVKKLQTQNEHIKGISFQRNYGKSAALNEAFKAALGDYIITMDADLQDSPDEIPELYEMITTGRYDIVSGWKKKRFDNALTKNIPSKLYNYVTGKLSGIQLHDMNCGLKNLASIMFVGKYGKKPMHIFGFWGILVFMVGAGIWIYLAIAKFAFMQYKMTERPLFYVGIISIVIGTQLFLAGFLGELISRNSSDRNSYNIAEKIGLDE